MQENRADFHKTGHKKQKRKNINSIVTTAKDCAREQQIFTNGPQETKTKTKTNWTLIFVSLVVVPLHYESLKAKHARTRETQTKIYGVHELLLLSSKRRQLYRSAYPYVCIRVGATRFDHRKLNSSNVAGTERTPLVLLQQQSRPRTTRSTLY